ncbi:MAG: AEC family transporter [Acholeplasmataceae bacterium]|jgi:predicted permease|nr:AEC family transporter [Acholeplasmataceae bacterium]
MEIIELLFIQILIMFVYIGIGLIMTKIKLIDDFGAKQLSKVLVYFITPVAILYSFTNMTFSKEYTIGLLVSMILSVAALGISIIVSRVAFGSRYTLEHFGTSFSNAGFMGIPLVMAILGPAGVFYISTFVALLNILQWTYGVFVITNTKDFIQPKKILTNPFVISFILGIIFYGLNGLGFHMPEIINNQLSIVSKMIGPIAMLIIGTYLSKVNFREIFKEKIVYASLGLRLLFIPLLTALIFLLVPKTYENIALSIMIVASAPVGANVAIFAALYGVEHKRAIVEICLSTLLAALTMPLMIAIFQWLF